MTDKVFEISACLTKFLEKLAKDFEDNPTPLNFSSLNPNLLCCIEEVRLSIAFSSNRVSVKSTFSNTQFGLEANPCANNFCASLWFNPVIPFKVRECKFGQFLEMCTNASKDS